MRLADGLFLLLALLIPLLHRFWVFRNRPAKIPFSHAIPYSVASFDLYRISRFLRYFALLLLILALARPQKSFKTQERSINGIDIMLLLDLSASMNIEDLEERPRMAIAKETLESFVKGRQNDRIGFSVFSGEPLTMVPPTLDYGLVLKSIRDINIGLLKDGTAIGDGLALTVTHLKNSKAKTKVIILLTDGENNLGQVDPLTAGELAVGFGMKVYTIAIGREGRVKLRMPHKTASGLTVYSEQWFDNALNPELLQKIAQMTNGRFYRVTDTDTLKSVFKEIDSLERTEIKAKEKIRYDENFQKPLKLAFFIFLLELCLNLFYWRAIP